MNAREALKEARALGAKVEHRRRTGEVLVKARGHRWVRIQAPSRRKCATRSLTVLLKKLRKEAGE